MLSERSPPEGQEDPPESLSSSAVAVKDTPSKTSDDGVTSPSSGNTSVIDVTKRGRNSKQRGAVALDACDEGDDTSAATSLREDLFVTDTDANDEGGTTSYADEPGSEYDEEGVDDSLMYDDGMLATAAHSTAIYNEGDMSLLTTDMESENSRTDGVDDTSDVDTRHDDIDGGLSDDDAGNLYLNPNIDRTLGVGNVTSSSDEDSSSSSSVAADGYINKHGDADDDTDVADAESSSEEEADEEEEVAAVMPVSETYNRRLPLMEESLCSLEEVKTEEEALTEGCREKTGIVGGSKWEELMGGMNGSTGVIPSKCDMKDNASTVFSSGSASAMKPSASAIFPTTLTTATIASNLSNAQTVSVSVPFINSISPKTMIVSQDPELPVVNKKEVTSEVQSATNDPLLIEHNATFSTNSKKSEVSKSAAEEQQADQPNIDSSELLRETTAVIANLSELEGSMSEKSQNFIDQRSDSFPPPSYWAMTQSVSSCGSKSGVYDGGKLSDCKLDSTTQSVVAALDDAAREAQLQLLNLHTQLQQYRRMSNRRKARKVIDARVNPSIKMNMLALKLRTELPSSHLPVALYPLKHSYISVPECDDCEQQMQLEELSMELYGAAMSSLLSQASQNVFSTSIFRRPGEKLYKVFMMREGHIRGRASTVRVVLSSHALYVLNTCPVPALLHALPYTQLHTVVVGAYKEWVVVLSRGVVESLGDGGVRGVNTIDTTRDTEQQGLGIQLCIADPEVTDEFVGSLEIQARRSIMAAVTNELKTISEGKTPNMSNQYLPGGFHGMDNRHMSRSESLRELEEYTHGGWNGYDHGEFVVTETRSMSSKVSTPMEDGQWRRCWTSAPPYSPKVYTQHVGLTDSIEHLIPSVVESDDWEPIVLQQWLRHLMPMEPVCKVLGSWLVEWDGGAVLGQQGALGPTMEGPLMFRTTKLFSTWKNSHFLLKAGVLYQFWCSGDRLPHTMLDITNCSACTPATQHNKAHAFQVIQSDGSPLLLAAPDADQAARWTRALSAVLATASGRPSARRPTPCRLLLLPSSLVLLHQNDLLLASPELRSPPPAPHPTPLPSSDQQTQGLPPYFLHGNPQAVVGQTPFAGNAAVEGRRDSKPNMGRIPSVSNLKSTKHLSSSLSSLNSNNSQSNTARNASMAKAGVGNGGPDPPRTLPLVTSGPPDKGCGGKAPPAKIRLNAHAEAHLLAKLELRHLCGIGRYNECSNTTLLVSLLILRFFREAN